MLWDRDKEQLVSRCRDSDIVDIGKGDGGGFEEGEGERKRREAATRDAILKMRRKRSDLRCSMQPDKI